METPRPTYRGHRKQSFCAEDLQEMNELRARHRTFDGAYRRTALANLGYALTVLRLFDMRFYKIGILYLVLSAFLFLFEYIRGASARHAFSDSSESDAKLWELAQPTKGQENAREFGKPFVTAGASVLIVAGLVAATEICVIVLIFTM
ncbi:hypothetical protein CONPUDRAFT_84609 [Coniophora puteana RWD-64-598 SS2]|uniref:DUF202 domain-containing protein n=1 Tax=Coniophora puteana (strain RWD-64-598) TaxID=741705 RepID=A0A5M3MC74_CONPW|nr:uncharacterized protein CONPUDRAFT_84609 [Coniophora puteana RWD-64-598 SS2]EIW76643.1 hypothetical protein CONPUDRAFT_84609 [Coniophora puteana RWD-64-598 SS2]